MEEPDPGHFSATLDARLYAQALSRGIDCAQRRGEPECLSRPVALLATATELTPALVLFTLALIHPWSDDREEQREALKPREPLAEEERRQWRTKFPGTRARSR